MGCEGLGKSGWIEHRAVGTSHTQSWVSKCGLELFLCVWKLKAKPIPDRIKGPASWPVSQGANP